MKAAVHFKYGAPDVVHIQEYPKPTPTNDQILVRVIASTVNRTDCGFRSAEYFISRFFSGLFKPKYNILGNEFAGVIEDIGKSVTQFQVGDKVFGYNDSKFGGHAEYLVISENDAIATIPKNKNCTESAPILEGSHYALSNLRAAKVKSNQKVLVNGGTGSIGSAAVQLLKQYEVDVTAVCGTQHIELLKSLGANQVIDYQNKDFTQTDDKFDFIFDAVGKSSFKRCKKLLKPKGIYISTELGKNGVNIPLALFTPLFGGKKVLFPIPSINKNDVLFIRSLVESGVFSPVVDRTYGIDQIVEAYTYVESGQKIGNVIIKVSD